MCASNESVRHGATVKILTNVFLAPFVCPLVNLPLSLTLSLSLSLSVSDPPHMRQVASMAQPALKVFVPARGDAVAAAGQPASRGDEATRKRRGEDAREAYLAVLAQPATPASPAVVDTEGGRARKRRRRHAPAPARRSATQLTRAAFLAVESGDVAQVQACVEEGLDVAAARDEFGWTLLMSACAQGNVTMAGALLGCDGATLAWVQATDTAGRTALDVATRQGHGPVVGLLTAAIAAAEAPPPSPPVAENAKEPEGQQGDLRAGALADPGFCALCQMERRNRMHEYSIPHLVACQHPAQHRQFVLGEANKGFQIMKRIGWTEGGLGPQQQGRLVPVKTTLRPDRAGIGAPGQPKPRVTHFAALSTAAVAPAARASKVHPKTAHAAERRREQRFRAMLSDTLS